MKFTYRFFQLVLTLVLIASFNRCDSNPFSGEDTIQGTSITGKVTLNDGQNPSNVFVWFEPLNISARADSNGEFNMQLPSPSAQSSGGLSGIYKLYYYMANYKIKSIDIALSGGKVQEFENNATLAKGEIPSVQLKKLIDIFTSQFEIHKTETQDDSILVFFRARAQDDVVTLKTLYSSPFDDASTLRIAGLVRSLDAENDFLRTFLYDRPGEGQLVIGNNTRNLHPMLVHIFQHAYITTFPPGRYEFIPYLIVEQSGIPDGLLDKLGREATTFCNSYVRYPIKIRHNILDTTDGS